MQSDLTLTEGLADAVGAGNPVAVAAGLAQLRLCNDDVYAAIDKTALVVAGLAADALTAAGVPHRVNSAGSLFSVFFTDSEVVDYATAKQQDTAAYTAFFHAMLDRGVYLPPSAYEAWFVGASHDEDALQRIADAAPHAARAAAEAQAAR